MSTALIAEIKGGHVCDLTTYAHISLTFPNGGKLNRTIEVCNDCGKAEGSNKTPEELLREWRGKGIKITIL